MKKKFSTVIASSFLTLAACGGGEAVSEEAEKPQPEDRNEVRLEGDAAKMPDGLPKMEGMRLYKSHAYDFDNKDRRRRSTQFFVKDSGPKEIIDFYAAAMEEQGMEISTNHRDSYSNARGENDAGWISVTSRGDKHARANEGETHAVMMQDFQRPQ